ncbi:MAG: two-component regulator propeller domain-containing protein [Gammaproteobacteria bacterium]|nr:two-component regulator propeller domain-containing protein [Gammaproteobacteria bacterium]
MLPVLSTPAGDIWMGTCRSGLVKLDERRRNVTKIDEGINHTVLSLASDADGSIWAGTRQGLARIQGDRVVDVFGVENGLPHPTVSSLFADGSKLWIGTEGGLAVLDNGSIRSIDDRGLIVDSIYTLIVDRTGTLWVGTNSGGVLRLVDDQLQRAPFDESTQLVAIFDFHEDDQGRLWIGTSHGLWRWASGSLQMIGKRDGLYEPSVFSVTQDAAGNLWTSGNHGIYRLKMSQVEEFLAGKTASISVRRFTDRDGMPRAETNASFQPTVSVTPAGELLYPTSSGLAVVDPAQLAIPLDPPVTRIIDARQDDNIRVSQQGHVDPFPGIVQFQFSAIEYSNPERVQFSYRLNGFDPQWRVTTNHNASFHQLPAGRYSFEVRARHGEGPWSAAAKHEFLVDRHWSRHPAVTGSVGIALILLGWYGTRRFLRSRALHRQRLQDTQKLEALGWMQAESPTTSTTCWARSSWRPTISGPIKPPTLRHGMTRATLWKPRIRGRPCRRN